MKKTRTPLSGGRSASSVTRIGDTVHRTLPSNHEFIHALLLYLEQNGFHEAPKYLRISHKNEQVISFMEGQVPRDNKLSYEQIAQCIKLLRRFHDVASNCPLSGIEETICHNDFAPWNIIFKRGMPVGIIDFDDCKPGKRIDDVAYFLWTFLDLGNSEISDRYQISRLVKLCHEYGLENWTELTEAILRQQLRILKFREDVVRLEKDKVKRDFSLKAIMRIRSEMVWLQVNKIKIEEMF